MELTKESYDDFVERLIYDCRGERVDDHGTRDVLFVVHSHDLVFGIDTDYTDKIGVVAEDSFFHSIDEFIKEWILDDDDESGFVLWISKNHDISRDEILSLDNYQKEYYINEFDQSGDGWGCITITGYDYKWNYVNSHLTYDAAKNFIRQNNHNYKELRVFGECQYRCHEFNAIKEAIMDGKLVLKEDT